MKENSEILMTLMSFINCRNFYISCSCGEVGKKSSFKNLDLKKNTVTTEFIY